MTKVKVLFAVVLCIIGLCVRAQLTTFPVTGGSGATTVAGISDAGTAAYSNATAFALAQNGTIVTQNNSFALVLSNTVKLDAASALSLSNATASRIAIFGADKTVGSATASGAVPIDADGTATTSAQVNALFPSQLLSNGMANATLVTPTLGNATVSSLTNSGLTASRIAMTDANKALSSAAASGAVPIDADGSAATAVQIKDLFPGILLTNNNVNAFVLFTNNLVSVNVNSSGLLTLTNYVGAGLGASIDTNGLMKLSTSLDLPSDKRVNFGPSAYSIQGNVNDLAFFNSSATVRFSLMNRSPVASLTLNQRTALRGVNNDAPESGVNIWQINTNGNFETAGAVTATNGIIFPLAATQVQLTNIVYTNTTLDFPSTASATFSDMHVPIANLKSNDTITINVPASSQTNGIWTAWISNTTAFARFHNYQATAINPASGIYNVQVFQYK